MMDNLTTLNKRVVVKTFGADATETVIRVISDI